MIEILSIGVGLCIIVFLLMLSVQILRIEKLVIDIVKLSEKRIKTMYMNE